MKIFVILEYYNFFKELTSIELLQSQILAWLSKLV